MQIVAAAVVLSACGELPRPFAHGPENPQNPTNPTNPTNPLIALRDGAGLKVEPLTGVPESIGIPLAESLAEALRRRNVMATVDAEFSGRYVLRGNRTSLEEVIDGKSRAHIVWTLSEKRGEVLGTLDQTVVGERQGWSNGDPALVDVVTRDAAPAIARYLQDSDREIAATAEYQPVLWLRSIEGAPGDGARALRRALSHHLRRRGSRVATSAEDKAIVVAGSVEVAAAKKGRQGVMIVWRVTAPDGRELGKIRQANTVPANMLNRRWGDIAFAIAAGAGDGIVDLLQRTAAITGHGAAANKEPDSAIN